jgi:hypothetical protein
MKERESQERNGENTERKERVEECRKGGTKEISRT